MKTRRSSSSALGSRLALALLALAGFAAPAAARELDGVVQTRASGAPRDQCLPKAEAPRGGQALAFSQRSGHERPARDAHAPLPRSAERRYLLHRAWLL